MSNVPVISIIDDDESVRLAIESLVRSLGFVAHTFSSAEEYLQSARRDDTSCVISDVQMPNMSGVELQEHLAAQGYATPIMFVTAFPDERVKARAMADGAVCFLVKPFEAKALIACLDKALNKDTGATIA